MTAATRLNRLNRTTVSPTRGAGELVRLPRGEFLAVVELPGDATQELRARGSQVGSRLPLTQQAHPALVLRESDAVGLREQDPVSVRSVEYLVVRLDPDGLGMTRVLLMQPGAESGPQPTWAQWR